MARGLVGSSLNPSQFKTGVPPGYCFLGVQICAELRPSAHPLFPGELERLRRACDGHASLRKLQRVFVSVIFESNPPTLLDSSPHLFLPFSPAFYKNIFAVVVKNIHPALIPTHSFCAEVMMSDTEWDFFFS